MTYLDFWILQPQSYLPQADLVTVPEVLQLNQTLSIIKHVN